MTTREAAQNRRVVVFAGGRLGEWALAELMPGDVLVGADKGALFLLRHGYTPHVALGDFDSVTAEEKGHIRAASLAYIDCDPVWKDLTDTEMAVAWALAQSPSSLLIVGALGTRFDHSLANVQLLKTASAAGVPCRIADEYNDIALLTGPGRLTVARGRFPYVSLLPLSTAVRGITLHGFRYPLQDAILAIGQSRGISNVLAAETGTIELREGDLLVVQSRD